MRNELKSVETEIKYAGYLDQQQKAIERLKKAEQRNIPDWFDYARVSGLSREMKEKLQHVPANAGAGEPYPWSYAGGRIAGERYIEIQARQIQQAQEIRYYSLREILSSRSVAPAFQISISKQKKKPDLSTGLWFIL